MAHFARIDENNIVTEVIAVNDRQIVNAYGAEDPELGEEYCKQLFGGRWKQTSYNSNFRLHYAGIGFSYREDLDVFVPPQPYSGWTFDDGLLRWIPPIPAPVDADDRIWDDETKTWLEP